MSYFPIDRKILESSIYQFGTAVEFKVWMHLLISANPRTGTLDQMPWYIAKQTNLEEAEVEAALQAFASPDPRSRTKDESGRRIQRDGNTITLLNYATYRDRDYSAPRVRAFRKRKRNGHSVTGNDVTPPSVTRNGGNDGHGHGTEMVVDVRSSPDVPGTENNDSRVAHAPRAKSDSWTEQACDDWIERHGGTAPGGQIGRHLRLLVEKYGWEVVRPAWRAYLGETEAQYANAGRFAATFGTWNRLPAAPKPPPPEPEPPAHEQDDAARTAFEEIRNAMKAHVPAQSWGTWIRPIEGWRLEDGILELAAPSPQHAEMLRGLYREKLRSAAAELGKTLKFKVFVR